jgi:radical SAM superfamily enzyme YgiQ (UPF0313 family)
LINLLKERYPSALVVAGGEHVSAIPEYCLRDCRGLDMIVVGEGEETIAEVAGRLKNGQSVSGVAGTVYKDRQDADTCLAFPRRQRIKGVTDIARPAWHLFPLNAYFDHGFSYGITYGRSLPICATRGCPYECTFCSSPQMWGTRYNMRDVDDVIDEIRTLHAEFGVTNFDFYDLTAIIKRQWILDFCARIEAHGLKITWQIPAGTRSEAIDYEVSVALKASGCTNISYAPESGSAGMLKAIKKRVQLPRMLRSIKDSHRAGLDVKLNMMLGFPDETLADMGKTLWFLVKASYQGATDAAPSIFSPYPGSALFTELEERKELNLSDDYFKSIVFSQSLQHVHNYNRHHAKPVMLAILMANYGVFYGSNYLFRPIRAFRLLWNVATRNYKTRGEYMLGLILRRNQGMKGRHEQA